MKHTNVNAYVGVAFTAAPHRLHKQDSTSVCLGPKVWQGDHKLRTRKLRNHTPRKHFFPFFSAMETRHKQLMEQPRKRQSVVSLPKQHNTTQLNTHTHKQNTQTHR